MKTGGAPPTTAPDPMLAQLEQQAKLDKAAAAQTQAAMDTGSLMARYGAQRSLSASAASSSPATTPGKAGPFQQVPGVAGTPTNVIANAIAARKAG